MGHGHHHDLEAPLAGTKRRLAIAIAINVAIVVAEVIGGYATGSLALLADAGHNLTDVGALVLALLASVFATLPANSRKSFGYYRLEILAALANGVLLVVVSILVLVEALRRFAAPPSVPGVPVLLVAMLALGGNLLSAAILMPRRSNLNVRGAFTHLVADAVSSVGVIVSAILVLAGRPIADAVAGVFIAVVIVLSGYGVMRESIDVLLQGVPKGVDVHALKRAVEGMPDVESVHDVHVWSLTSGVHVASLHVVVAPHCLGRCDDIVSRVSRALHDDFAIEHTTVQVETPSMRDVGHVHD